MLQSFAKWMSGFGSGEKPGRWPAEPGFTVFKVPFETWGREWGRGEGPHTLGTGDIVSVGVWL